LTTSRRAVLSEPPPAAAAAAAAEEDEERPDTEEFPSGSGSHTGSLMDIELAAELVPVWYPDAAAAADGADLAGAPAAAAVAAAAAAAGGDDDVSMGEGGVHSAGLEDHWEDVYTAAAAAAAAARAGCEVQGDGGVSGGSAGDTDDARQEGFSSASSTIPIEDRLGGECSTQEFKAAIMHLSAEWEEQQSGCGQQQQQQAVRPAGLILVEHFSPSIVDRKHFCKMPEQQAMAWIELLSVMAMEDDGIAKLFVRYVPCNVTPLCAGAGGGVRWLRWHW
jgi:hypothetical protein